MAYSDRQFVNPPAIWHNDDLQMLYHRLTTYQGQDCFAHPLGRSSNGDNIGACVLVLMTNEACPRLLLTKRSRHLSAHKSEIAFVGGHRDDTDTSTAHTALREAFEEVGLPETYVNVIGYLPIQTAKSGKAVRPVVAVIDGKIADELVGAECEVERLFWVALDYFVKTPPKTVCFDYDGRHLQTVAWQTCGENIWGLTGRMIASLIEIGYHQKINWYYQLSLSR